MSCATLLGGVSLDEVDWPSGTAHRPVICVRVVSACSNQNVISIDWYIAMAVESAAQPSSR